MASLEIPGRPSAVSGLRPFVRWARSRSHAGFGPYRCRSALPDSWVPIDPVGLDSAKFRRRGASLDRQAKRPDRISRVCARRRFVSPSDLTTSIEDYDTEAVFTGGTC